MGLSSTSPGKLTAPGLGVDATVKGARYSDPCKPLREGQDRLDLAIATIAANERAAWDQDAQLRASRALTRHFVLDESGEARRCGIEVARKNYVLIESLHPFCDAPTPCSSTDAQMSKN